MDRPSAGRVTADLAMVVVVLVGIAFLLLKVGPFSHLGARWLPYDLLVTGALAPEPLRPHELVLMRRRPDGVRTGQAVRFTVPDDPRSVHLARVVALGPDTLAVPPEARIEGGVLVDSPARVPRAARILAPGTCLIHTTATDTTATRVGWVLGVDQVLGRAVAVVFPPGRWRRLP